MKRKSKVPQKADVQANGANPIAEEIESITEKNLNLVKQLQQYKVALTEAIDERDQAKRELLGERAFNGKILRYVRDIQKAAQSNMNNILSSSNNISEIIKATNAIHHLTNKEATIHSETVSASNSPNKTQVVNPMIAGHVILRPIINLQRVNEISSEEIRRLSNPHLQLNNSNLDNYNNTNEEPSSPASSNQSSRNGIIRHGEDNQILEFKFEEEPRRGLDSEFEQNTGLGTIIEGAEESNELPNNILELSRPGCSRQPLLSGVFHDVRMYVSSVPEMLDNINTQRGSSTKSLKLTKSPNMTSKSSKKLSNRNQSCVQSNILEENFDLSSDNFNLPGTPVLSSTRLNASNLMLTEPRPSTSFRHDDDLPNSLNDTDQPEQSTVKRVTFHNVNVLSRRGKRENERNNVVKNTETILQSPDSSSKLPENNKLDTTTQLDDLSTKEQKLTKLESLQGTPTSSKIDTPLLSESSHLRVSRRKKVVATTSDDNIDSVPRTRGRPKAKKNICNSVSVPIKRITRSKYRKPNRHVDSVYTSRKSDDTKPSGSLELIKENSEDSVSKREKNASQNQTKVSRSQSNASKNQSVIQNDQSIVSNNFTNASKSSQSINDTNASTKNKSGKRKMQESQSENLVSSPRKRRAAKVTVSLKEPSLMKKMRR